MFMLTGMEHDADARFPVYRFYAFVPFRGIIGVEFAQASVTIRAIRIEEVSYF